MGTIVNDPAVRNQIRTYEAALELIRANDIVRIVGAPDVQRVTVQDYWRLTAARSRYDKLRNGSHGHSRY